MDWRVLVVDDEMAQDAVEIITGHKVMLAPDSISCETCDNFLEAITMLEKKRYDLVILDLKGGGETGEDGYAGERVYEQLKSLRFIPVIFFSGYAQKIKHLESSFVKVVAKGDNPQDLRSAVKEVFATKLPKLVRHIEEEQRKFMWESADKIWVNDFDKGSSVDLVYLLARRLGNLLSGDVIRNYLELENEGAARAPKLDKVHAVELYVWPPVSDNILFGDIYKNINGEEEIYFVALTPSCDHAHGKAEFVFMAKCNDFKDTGPWKKLRKYIDKNEEPSANAKREVMDILNDNGRPTDRFKFLPGTSFIPDLVIDLQNTQTIVPEILRSRENGYLRIASMDSPFAESLQAQMTRYFARIGTPDLDTELVFERIRNL